MIPLLIVIISVLSAWLFLQYKMMEIEREYSTTINKLFSEYIEESAKNIESVRKEMYELGLKHGNRNSEMCDELTKIIDEKQQHESEEPQA